MLKDEATLYVQTRTAKSGQQAGQFLYVCVEHDMPYVEHVDYSQKLS